jgi:hypothetical protein
MSTKDEWDEVADPDEEPKKQSLKEQLLPCNQYNMPIPERFCKTTKALFYEYRYQTTVTDKAPYTLRYQDFIDPEGHMYKSMYQIYMRCDSEYEAAIAILGSYPHWKKLKRCSWFHDDIERWEEERNIRDEAIARSILVTLAECGNVTAARTLFANANATKKAMGRPEKGGKRMGSTGDEELDAMLGRSKDANGD